MTTEHERLLALADRIGDDSDMMPTFQDLLDAATALRELAAIREAAGKGWRKLTDCLPDPAKHDRVLIYTEGSDFSGAWIDPDIADDGKARRHMQYGQRYVCIKCKFRCEPHRDIALPGNGTFPP